jgi:L-lactate dehydrogenase complex protein LldF
LCGNCTSVCPVKIDLAHHLLHNRRNAVKQGGRPWRERLGMRLWRWAMMDQGRFQMAGRMGRAMLRVLGGMGASAFKPWTDSRELPATPQLTFRQMWEQNNYGSARIETDKNK